MLELNGVEEGVPSGIAILLTALRLLSRIVNSSDENEYI